jgi:primosomal protein N' (replication factor Y)
LHFADFRVHERAFQLMEQVSGRAGRRDGVGKVMIQTGNPVHPVLAHVARHDYIGMYNEEIEKRKQFSYPPFTRIIRITFRHKEREVVQEGAHLFANSLDVPYGKYLVGPAEPVINRVRNLFLMEMLIKLPRDINLIAQCKNDLQKGVSSLHAEKKFAKLMIVPDVDAI